MKWDDTSARDESRSRRIEVALTPTPQIPSLHTTFRALFTWRARRCRREYYNAVPDYARVSRLTVSPPSSHSAPKKPQQLRMAQTPTQAATTAAKQATKHHGLLYGVTVQHPRLSILGSEFDSRYRNRSFFVLFPCVRKVEYKYHSQIARAPWPPSSKWSHTNANTRTYPCGITATPRGPIEQSVQTQQHPGQESVPKPQQSPSAVVQQSQQHGPSSPLHAHNTHRCSSSSKTSLPRLLGDMLMSRGSWFFGGFCFSDLVDLEHFM